MTRIAGLSDLGKWPSRSILLIVLVCCGAASACSDGVCADKAALVTALTNCDHLEVNCAAQNVKDWDVSAVTDMSSLFHYKHDFDGDLSSWDVSSVTTMNSMFGYAYSFSSDISNWDVSSVTDGHYLFYEADNFNADIGDWDVGSFTTMEAMFRQTFSFNRDLNGWDVGSVTNMQEMFRSQAGDEPHSRMGVTFPGGSPFNGDISSWDVASVSNMYEVFDNANRFNSDISDWDVSGATGNMAWLFADASAFNADLSRWDVGGVTNMNSMFKDAVSFDRDLGDWDIAAVTDSGNFIIRASAFRAETRCDPFYTGTTTDTCDAPREAIPVPPPPPPGSAATPVLPTTSETVVFTGDNDWHFGTFREIVTEVACNNHGWDDSRDFTWSDGACRFLSHKVYKLETPDPDVVSLLHWNNNIWGSGSPGWHIKSNTDWNGSGPNNWLFYAGFRTTGSGPSLLGATMARMEPSTLTCYRGGWGGCPGEHTLNTAAADAAAAEAAEDYACRTEITVTYSQPEQGPTLGPIVLGRGANGAAVSLYPGTFRASSTVWVCNAVTNVMEGLPAYRGEANVVYDGSSSMSIVLYAIDVRQPLNVASLQNFAPLITSIQINAQTVDVGEAATITATGYDFNAADTVQKMALSVFDTTDDEEIALNIYQDFGSGQMNTATLQFTPIASDFTDSDDSAHRLLATVTATDNFDATGDGQVPLTVNRLVGVRIGAVTFNRPRVSLDVTKQHHTSVAGANIYDSLGFEEAAVAKFDIFDADSVAPYPYDAYRESHTYYIGSIAPPVNPIAPAGVAVGVNLNNVPTPGNCNGATCQYTECVCTRPVLPDDDGNFGCEEIDATQAGDEWTFTWNPWSGVEDPSRYGVTFCELKVHFIDNTASASRDSIDGLTQATLGLETQQVTILLQAKPGTSGLNYPPAVSLFYAVHVDLEEGNTMDTTITVQYEDQESPVRPGAQLGFFQPDCSDGPASCFVAFTDANAALSRAQTDEADTVPAGQAGAWQGVYTFNGDDVLPDASGSTLKVYLQLVDAADASMVGYHEMATLTRLAARRRRRRQAAGDAAASRAEALTISIDENGRLTAAMEFPNDAVVSVNVDTAGGSTRAPDDRGDDRGDDHIRTDDGSSDRQLVIILALAGGVGCCCLLGAAICLGYAMLRRNGTASVGPSPTRRPTKILVSGAAPGLEGPRKDPFAGFQTA